MGASAALAAAFAAGLLVARGSQATVMGSFTVIPRGGGLIIAAPHGDFDLHTGTMVRAICQRLQSSCIVARGFNTEGPRLNINRPTEGVRLSEAVFSTRAAQVYDGYLYEMQAIDPEPRLYVELHGNGHPTTRDRIEVATAGVSVGWAKRIQQAMNRAFARARLTHYTTHVDVLEPIRYTASHNRQWGALSEMHPALHIELPRRAREQDRDEVIDALVSALSELAADRQEPAQFAMWERS